MKASYGKTLLLVLMCLCLFGCSKGPTEPVLTSTPVEGESFSIPDVNLDMLWCQPGTFMMGSPEDEKYRQNRETQHEVTLTKGFYLGKYEVTKEQWEKVMGSNPSRFRFKGANHPVENVSWDDAMQFCEKLTQAEKAAGRLPEGWVYTLPTEAQWEFACRAGTTTAYSYGNTITPKQANYEEGKIGKTTSVGTYPANAWGFHDMHGNVWEWCSDWYWTYPSGSVSDPVGPSGGPERVGRGGCWYDDGGDVRSADRSGDAPGNRYDGLGFRLSLQTETVKTEGAGRADAEPAQRATGVAPVPSITPGSTAKPVAGKSFTIPNPKLDMLWCKPGTFMMGSPSSEKDRNDDETQHRVNLTQGFWLGKHEVTQEQWQKVMGSNPSNFKGATLPVEQVSWDDAMKFCEKLTQMEKTAGRLREGWTYTLPTEAQWEYACRAGTTTAYSFGDEITPKQANFNGNVGKTTDGLQYPANAWGFHDMHGNVWEWCSDWYGDYPDGSASDPVGPSDGTTRVNRGGGWINYGRSMRSAIRYRNTPDDRYYYLGFRLSLQTETEKTE